MSGYRGGGRMGGDKRRTGLRFWSPERQEKFLSVGRGLNDSITGLERINENYIRGS